jgi:flagellar hook assembly protein FlgD
MPYQLSEASEVKITLYDAQGRVVRQLDLGYQSAGIYRIRARAAYWDG